MTPHSGPRSGLPRRSKRDWKEDHKAENGNYMCRCAMCEETFYGHKRRNCCRLCAPTHEHYYEAGSFERPGQFYWRQGYSLVLSAESLGCQPWVSKLEAEQESKARGAYAVFHKTLEDAQQRIRDRAVS